MVDLRAPGPRPAGGDAGGAHGGKAGGREPRHALGHGVQYQHDLYVSALRGNGFTQSMSRKGNCIDNGATEQVFGHLKDEFFRGRDWDAFESFKADLEAYIHHWNHVRRQKKLGGLTPVEFRERASGRRLRGYHLARPSFGAQFRDAALGYTRSEQKVLSPPVETCLVGDAHAEQPSPPRRLFPFASSITPCPA